MYYRYLFFIVYFLSFPVSSQEKILLILGDSISAAYGIPLEKGWVSLLQHRLLRQGYDYKVVNVSITGETTLGAKMRMDNLIEKYQPELVVIELGGNDGLRGFTFKEIENNFLEMIHKLKQVGSKILLVPMQLPPNYGMAYNKGFTSIYDRVSESTIVPVSEFIFQGFAEDLDMMQADGIHPVESAQSIMLDNIWPDLYKLIKK